jgi:predicted membrane protein
MLERTWIAATGQRWKVYILFGLLALTVLWFGFTLAYLEYVSANTGSLFLLILFVVILSFIAWTLLAVLCPFCRTRVIWKILRTLPHEKSVQVAFFLLTECPECKRSFQR